MSFRHYTVSFPEETPRELTVEYKKISWLQCAGIWSCVVVFRSVGQDVFQWTGCSRVPYQYVCGVSPFTNQKALAKWNVSCGIELVKKNLCYIERTFGSLCTCGVCLNFLTDFGVSVTFNNQPQLLIICFPNKFNESHHYFLVFL